MEHSETEALYDTEEEDLNVAFMAESYDCIPDEQNTTSIGCSNSRHALSLLNLSITQQLSF